MKKFLFKILVLAGIGHYAVKLFPRLKDYAMQHYSHLFEIPFENHTHPIRSSHTHSHQKQLTSSKHLTTDI